MHILRIIVLVILLLSVILRFIVDNESLKTGLKAPPGLINMILKVQILIPARCWDCLIEKVYTKLFFMSMCHICLIILEEKVCEK